MLDNVIVDTTSDPAPLVQNLIKNGGFESGLATCAGLTSCRSSQTDIAPWTNIVPSEPIDVVSFLLYQPALGAYSIDLNSDKPTAIYQQVSLLVGLTYTLSFSYSKNGGCDDNDRKGYVHILNDATDMSTFGGLYQQFIGTSEWQVSSFSFVAAHPTVKVAFGSLEVGGCGPAIDNVSLVLDSAPQSFLKRRSRR